MGMVMLSVPAATNFWSYVQQRSDMEGTVMHSPRWTYQRRGLATPSRDTWTTRGGLWPTRSGFMTDPAASLICPFSNDMGSDSSGEFEPWRFGFGGSQGLKFIMGRCVDGSEVMVPNAVVQIFLTSDDSLQRETQATDQGYYEAGTDKVGAAHYLVAYKAGSPDIAGTTVNTLTPLNRDGT